MLDLNHPMTEHIFRASGLLDGILKRGQEMSVSPSHRRSELLSECILLLGKMIRLNAEQFEGSHFITVAIGECETGLRQLAELGNGQIVEDRRDGSGNCPVCGTAITSKWVLILCGECDKYFMPAITKLHGFNGFCTDAI